MLIGYESRTLYIVTNLHWFCMYVSFVALQGNPNPYPACFFCGSAVPLTCIQAVQMYYISSPNSVYIDSIYSL